MIPAGLENHDTFLAPGRLWSRLDMLRIYAKPFIEASELIGQLFNTVADINVYKFHPDVIKIINEKVNILIEQLDIADLEMTKQSAERFKDQIYIDGIAPSLCSYYLHQIADRLKDEIAKTYLLSLSPKEAALFYSEGGHYGESVATAFTSIAYEIDEAAKCLALERSTASAFHSIRALEAAIRAIARCLGIPDPTRAADRNWGKVLGAVESEMDRRWPSTSDRMSGDGRFFEEAYAALAAMQNPFRNATMHLDQKYTPEEARHIFEIVGGFMKKLASRMDEEGLPLA